MSLKIQVNCAIGLMEDLVSKEEMSQNPDNNAIKIQVKVDRKLQVIKRKRGGKGGRKV